MLLIQSHPETIVAQNMSHGFTFRRHMVVESRMPSTTRPKKLTNNSGLAMMVSVQGTKRRDALGHKKAHSKLLGFGLSAAMTKCK